MEGREESVGCGKTKKGGAECATLLMASGPIPEAGGY